MRKIFQPLFISGIFLMLASLSLQAQDAKLSGTEKKADTYVDYQDFANAEKEYKAILEKKKIATSEKDRVSIKLANAFYSTRRYEEAEKYFEKAAHNSGAFTQKQEAAFLTTLIRNGKNQRAREIDNGFTKVQPL